MSSLNVAVVGCCHGELDKIYGKIKDIESRTSRKVDLLLICGDFQGVCNKTDLECVAMPWKYRHLNTFHQYVSGEKRAYVKTIFIGGNHEASNHLQDLYYGGYAAPNIYFLGFAGVVNYRGLKIGGLSGIFNSKHYRLGRYEHPPYTEDTIRSIYHVRELEIYRMVHMQQSPQKFSIFMTHDWPTGIWEHGDCKKLLKIKPFLREDIETGKLGSPPAMHLLSLLKPQYWFSGHMHVKFDANVYHSGNKNIENSNYVKNNKHSKPQPSHSYYQPAPPPLPPTLPPPQQQDAAPSSSAAELLKSALHIPSITSTNTSTSTSSGSGTSTECKVVHNSEEIDLDDFDSDSNAVPVVSANMNDNNNNDEFIPSTFAANIADTTTQQPTDALSAYKAQLLTSLYNSTLTTEEVDLDNDVSDDMLSEVENEVEEPRFKKLCVSNDHHNERQQQRSNYGVDEDVTRFTALDKVLPNRSFLEVFTIPVPPRQHPSVTSSSQHTSSLHSSYHTEEIHLDAEWLTIVRKTHGLIQDNRGVVQLPHEIVMPTEEEIAITTSLLSAEYGPQLVVPNIGSIPVLCDSGQKLLVQQGNSQTDRLLQTLQLEHRWTTPAVTKMITGDYDGQYQQHTSHSQSLNANTQRKTAGNNNKNSKYNSNSGSQTHSKYQPAPPAARPPQRDYATSNVGVGGVGGVGGVSMCTMNYQPPPPPLPLTLPPPMSQTLGMGYGNGNVQQSLRVPMSLPPPTFNHSSNSVGRGVMHDVIGFGDNSSDIAVDPNELDI